ncbi:uncharacterized protein Z519_07902 [Cladophialophora bantiana CBS 173.52]|uniref:Uncharacterized protein n=1 Tax=Cladophialophora bantiana (strain ATCC 10958 / CBS 173.52 / CDC B-1940 / NIH 8579) TaxID=1442370 RepID=A0A0D2FZP0_CLAB1|nr:uncharacterized protein Z519_07902 [Cladophialophora bantiana CBS 173.52]KIW91932.1 hypothetical protein Z519_07902 [Cladophialophora bantiana CBS 173.52]
MAVPFVWDPDRVLQITDLGRNEIICIGRAARRFNSRCTWTIEEPEVSHASSLLASMARKLPTEVRNEELRVLARLCLCHQAHQHQQKEAFLNLQSLLQYARDDYERFKTLQLQNIELRTEVLNGKVREISLCQKVDEQATAASKLQETERGLKSQLAHMCQQLDQQNTTIAKLQDSESGLRRTSDYLEQLLQKGKLTVASLEKSNTGLEGQLTGLRRQLYDQKVAVDELEASKSELQGQLHELRQQLNQQNTAVRNLEDENRTLKDQHTAAVAELGTSQLKLEQMKSELQSVRIGNADLQRQLDEAFILGRLGINNAWLTRLRNWLRAYQLLFTGAFRRVRHVLATLSAKLMRFWPNRGLFRGVEPVAGKYLAAEEMLPRHRGPSEPPV